MLSCHHCINSDGIISEHISGVGINLNISAPRDLKQKGLNVQIFMQVCRSAESIVAADLFA